MQSHTATKMKDFLSIDIDSTLLNGDVFVILSDGLPEFSWRQGDSDAQGAYVSGRNPEGVQIQCWTGEAPMQMSVSFRGAKDVPEEARAHLVNRLLADLLPRIGRLKEIDG